jgi:hypothetical protein
MDQDDKEAIELTQVALTELGGGQPTKKTVIPKKVESLPGSQESPHKSQGQKGGNHGHTGGKMDMEVKAN